MKGSTNSLFILHGIHNTVFFLLKCLRSNQWILFLTTDRSPLSDPFGSIFEPVARRGHPLLLLLFFQKKSCVHNEVGTCTEILPWFLSHAFSYSPLSSTLRFRPELIRLLSCPEPSLVDAILNLWMQLKKARLTFSSFNRLGEHAQTVTVSLFIIIWMRNA